MKLKHCLILLLAGFYSSAFASTWDLNDVSYLFPLPSGSNDANFVKASEVIPFAWFTKNLADSNGLPFSVDQTLRSSSTPDQIRAQATSSFNSLRLLAVRIDPCFRDLYSDPCRPQIRAVWQPTDSSGNTVDATMHTFYDFSNQEFRAIEAQLQSLKAKYNLVTTGLPLQVHPGFKQNGFARDLSALLRTLLKTDHITRVAFAELLGAEFQWRLLGFNVRNGVLTQMEIPLHNDIQQTFAVHGGAIPPGDLELSKSDLARLDNGVSLDQVLLDYTLRIENPRINIPGTTDCLSCHAAGGVKGASAASLQLDPIPTVAAVVGLTGKYNLQNISANRQDPIHFRAFGYVFRNVSISDRVIIETAMVADELNREK